MVKRRLYVRLYSSQIHVIRSEKRKNSPEPARGKRKGKMSSAKFSLECGASEMNQNGSRTLSGGMMVKLNDASRLRVELGRKWRVLIIAKRSEKRERPLCTTQVFTCQYVL